MSTMQDPARVERFGRLEPARRLVVGRRFVNRRVRITFGRDYDDLVEPQVGRVLAVARRGCGPLSDILVINTQGRTFAHTLPNIESIELADA